jgi:transcriptional regulator with XRE-family HTH domain
VGERIRSARVAAGLTQAELAAKAGLQPSAVSHFETGSRTPALASLTRLADALACSMDSLAGRWQPRFCAVRADGRTYLAPAGRRSEVFAAVEAAEAYWSDLGRVERESAPEWPEWAVEVDAHLLTFADPRCGP